MLAGKTTPYEEDVHVPFYIRGPGLKEGVTTNHVGSHVDLPATIVSLAGGKLPALADGQSLPLHLFNKNPGSKDLPQPKQPYDL